MNILRSIPFVISFLSIVCLSTQGQVNDFKSEWEISCMIRKDKINYVMPKAMQENNIDMWIVIDNGRGTEPMMLDFGIETSYGQGIYVFCNNGKDGIKAYALRGPGSSKLSGLCGIFDESKNARELRSIVYERDPKSIALNYLDPYMEGEGIHNADGLSYTAYKWLVEQLGDRYSERFVSAQELIVHYRGEHVSGEIAEFSKVAQITERELDRAFSNEVITPGVTTELDVEMWLEERRQQMGLGRTWFPGVWLVGSTSNGSGRENSTDRVIQRGDIICVDWGLYSNHYSTDLKRNAYVCRDGETEPPADLVNAFNEAVKVREIIRRNVRVGRTGREQLDDLKQIIRDAGYVYTEVERASDSPGIEVNIGMHGMGNIAHDVASGLAEFSPELAEYEILPNAFLALEFRIFYPTEILGGTKIAVDIEENVVITERGIEWVHPPQNEIRIIR